MTNLFNIQNSITVGDVTHFVQFNKIMLIFFFLHLCLHLFETCYRSCLQDKKRKSLLSQAPLPMKQHRVPKLLRKSFGTFPFLFNREFKK